MAELKNTFSLYLKKDNTKAVEFANLQSNLSDAITYLFEKEIYENGMRNLADYIPARRTKAFFDAMIGTGLAATRMPSFENHPVEAKKESIHPIVKEESQEEVKEIIESKDQDESVYVDPNQVTLLEGENEKENSVTNSIKVEEETPTEPIIIEEDEEYGPDDDIPSEYMD